MTLEEEIINHIFKYWLPQEWNENLYALIYGSELHPVREFTVVFDKNYKILYTGWELSEAYWDSVRAPKKDEYMAISYIRNIESDNYIFFNEYGKRISPDMQFTKVDNMDGEIVAKSGLGWWIIETNGARPEV